MGNTQQSQKAVQKIPEEVSLPRVSQVPRESIQMQQEYSRIEWQLIPRTLLASRLDYNEFSRKNGIRNGEDVKGQWHKRVDGIPVHKSFLEDFTCSSLKNRFFEVPREELIKQLFKEIVRLGKQNPPLKKLNLSFVKIWLDDKLMQVLITHIGRYLTNLEYLKFYLQGPTITNKTLEALGSSICRHLTKLKHIGLEFENCNMDHSGFESLLNQLNRHLISLENLSLKFKSCDVLNNDVGKSAKAFRARHTSLENISLSFHSCPKLTIEGIQTLSFIQNHKYLKQLQLSFSQCNMTDDYFKLLLSFINKGLNKLELLSLNITDSNTITNKSTKAIETMILPALSNLKALKLEFIGCNITKQGREKLENAIRTQKLSFEKLLLYFPPAKH